MWRIQSRFPYFFWAERLKTPISSTVILVRAGCAGPTEGRQWGNPRRKRHRENGWKGFFTGCFGSLHLRRELLNHFAKLHLSSFFFGFHGSFLSLPFDASPRVWRVFIKDVLLARLLRGAMTPTSNFVRQNKKALKELQQIIFQTNLRCQHISGFHLTYSASKVSIMFNENRACQQDHLQPRDVISVPKCYHRHS